MEAFNTVIWTYIFLPLMLCCGVLLTVRSGGLQFRRFGLAMRSLFRRSDSADGSITQAQAVCTALASTVGTGNIIGTAQAIAMGGRGAVLWLWIAALLGMIIKYAEIFLGVRFRKRVNGVPVGGPMYYIEQGLGPRFKPLAAAYALFSALSVLCMGNMAQISGAVSAVARVAEELCPLSNRELYFFRLALGIALALVLYITLIGGARRVGKMAELLVPFMSGIFLLFTLTIVICHAQRLPEVIAGIVHDALSIDAAAGAAGGLMMKQAVHWGVRRGAFSNEAGLGYAAIAHASADGEPAQQGLWGIFEVFADTILICTATALAILCSGISIPWGSTPGAELLETAAATVFGARFSCIIMALSLFLFAFSTVVGCSVYGLRCTEYLFGSAADEIYRMLFCTVTVLGSVMSTARIWLAADTVNALLAVPNFIALIALSRLIGKESRRYFHSNP